MWRQPLLAADHLAVQGEILQAMVADRPSLIPESMALFTEVGHGATACGENAWIAGLVESWVETSVALGEAPSLPLISLLNALGLRTDDLRTANLSIAALNQLQAVETHSLLRYLRWLNLSYGIERSLRWIIPVVNARTIQGSVPAETGSSREAPSRWPIWVQGRNLLLRDTPAIRTSYLISGLNQGTTQAFGLLLKAFIAGFFAFQLIESLPGVSTAYLPQLLRQFSSYNSRGFEALLHFFADIQLRYTGLILAVPPLVGLGRGLFYSRQGRPLTEKHLRRWAVYFRQIPQDGNVFAETSGCWRLIERVWQACGLPRPRRWQERPLAPSLPPAEATSWPVFWHYWFRPLWPWDPTSGRLGQIERNLRWNGFPIVNRQGVEIYSLAEKQRLLFRLLTEVVHQPGLVKRTTYRILAKLAHGIALTQLPLLQRYGYDREALLTALVIKAQALRCLQAESTQYRRFWRFPTRRQQAAAFLYAFWAEGQLWELGLSSHWGWGVFFTLWQLGLITGLAFFLKTIVENAQTYLTCPYQPFSFAHGYRYTNFYSSSCWATETSIFNQPLPGQPLEDYLMLLPLFQLNTLSSTQALANQGWNGDELSRVMGALRAQGAPLDTLVLTGQNLSTVASVQALIPAISPTTQVLSIGNSGLEVISSAPTVALAQSLPPLPQLREFYAIHNNLGFFDSSGVVALAQWLGEQPQLEVVSFLDSLIGNTDGVGVMAMARMVTQLPRLKVLNVADGALGLTEANGVGQLIEALIGRRTTLQQLNLQNNFLGAQGTEALATFVAAFGGFEVLESLDISGNNIPVNTPVGEALMLEFIQAAVQLPKLQTLYFQQTVPIAPPLVQRLRPLLLQAGITTDLPRAVTVAEAQALVAALPTTLTSLDLSRQLSNPSPDVMRALLEGLAQQCPHLQSLNLSSNQLGLENADNVVALAQGLHALGQQGVPLQRLLLQNNLIDLTDGMGSLALAELALPVLPQLQVLALDNNNLGFMRDASAGPQRLFENLCFTPQLQQLSIKGNFLDRLDSLASQALGATLQRCGLPITQLDLSFNYMGYSPAGNEGVTTLFRGIGACAPTLKIVNVAYNFIDTTADALATQAVLDALASCTLLEQLFLHRLTGISWGQAHEALAHTLQPTVNAVELFKACQQEVCFAETLTLPHGILEPVPASPILPQNPLVSVSSAAASETAAASIVPLVQNSAPAQRQLLQVTHNTHDCSYAPSQDRWFCTNRQAPTQELGCGDLDEGIYYECELMSAEDMANFPEEIADTAFPSLQAGVQALVTSVVLGAALTATPVVVREGLEAVGISPTAAAQSGELVNTIVLFSLGSWLATTAKYATQWLCRYGLGCRPATAELAGNVVATTVTVAQNLTPVGLATTALTAVGAAAGSYAANRCIFWAKNRANALPTKATPRVWEVNAEKEGVMP